MTKITSITGIDKTYEWQEIFLCSPMSRGKTEKGKDETYKKNQAKLFNGHCEQGQGHRDCDWDQTHSHIIFITIIFIWLHYQYM